MRKSKKKVVVLKKSYAMPIALGVIALCCVLGYFIYNLPTFWVRPATVEFSPEEGKGLYLGMSAPLLKTVKGKLFVDKVGRLFKTEVYYDRKLEGKHFDKGHYDFNYYGRLVNYGFSKHMKTEEIEKVKYEYLKFFISKYGVDYKKAICIYQPYTNKRFVYQMLVWEKKDARIVLDFSFYDNAKDGFYCKNRGVYLNIYYPGNLNEDSHSNVVDNPENTELKEAFMKHFPDFDNSVRELKSASSVVTPEKTK